MQFIIIDINECIEDISGCGQICKNTNGSFICDCYDKFDLESDGKSCTGKYWINLECVLWLV